VPRIAKTDGMEPRTHASQFTPLHDRVLVRRREQTEPPKGLLLIPIRRKKSPRKATVFAVAGGGNWKRASQSPRREGARRPDSRRRYTGRAIRGSTARSLDVREEKTSGQARRRVQKAGSGKKNRSDDVRDEVRFDTQEGASLMQNKL